MGDSDGMQFLEGSGDVFQNGNYFFLTVIPIIYFINQGNCASLENDSPYFLVFFVVVDFGGDHRDGAGEVKLFHFLLF